MITFLGWRDPLLAVILTLMLLMALFLTTSPTSSVLASSGQETNIDQIKDELGHGQLFLQTTETSTPTPTATPTATITPTATTTATVSATTTATRSATVTTSATPTLTPTPTATPTRTQTPNNTPTPSSRSEPTAAPTASPTGPLTPTSVKQPPPYTSSDANCLWFTQAASGNGGFSVCDDLNAKFRHAFEYYGLKRLGYPISTRFMHDGFIMQAFQKGIFQWRTSDDDIILVEPQIVENKILQWHDLRDYTTFVNLFDELHDQNFDDQLEANYQVPQPLPQTSESHLTFEQLVEKRQQLLDARPALRDAYFAVKHPLTSFGLPSSHVQDMGSHYAIRLQRAVLQEWKQAVPWAPAGYVTIINSGDIAKAFDYLPTNSLTPEVGPFDSTTYAPDSFKEAIAKYEANAYAEAIPLLEDLVQDSSVSSFHNDIKAALAVSYCNQEKYEAALARANELLSNDSESEWRVLARAVLVSSHYERGEYEQAWHAWAQLRQHDPNNLWAADDALSDLLRTYCNPDLEEQGGIFFYPSRGYKEAARKLSEQFSNLATPSSSDAALLFEQAIGYYKQKRYPEAFAPLQLLIETYPQDKWGSAAQYFWTDIFVQLNSYIATDGCTTKFVLGYHEQALLDELIEQAACLGNAGNQIGEANTLQNIGTIYYAQGKYDQARTSYQAAFKIWHKRGNTIRAGSILHDLGVINDIEGDYNRALEYYQHAIHILRQTPTIWHTEAQLSSAYTLNKIGSWYEANGNYDKARAIYLETVGAWRDLQHNAISVNHANKEAEAWRNIGSTYHAQNLYGEALNAYQIALNISQEQQEPAEQASTLNQIGLVYHAQERYTETLQTYRQALDLWDQSARHVEKERINTLNQIGLAYYAQGKYSEALIYYQQALDLTHAQQDAFEQGLTLQNMGLVYQAQQRYAEAQANYEQALAQWYKSRPRNVTFVHTLEVPFFSGLTYQHYGRYAFATQHANQPLFVRLLSIPKAGEANTLNNLAATYALQMDFSNTKNNYEQAQQLQAEFGDVVGAQFTAKTFETLLVEQHFDDPEVRAKTKTLLAEIRCMQGDATACGESSE